MYSKVSRRYSLALYNTALKTGVVNDVTKDVGMMINLFKSSRDLYLFFLSPVISTVKKNKIVSGLFEKKVSELTYKFIKLLITHNRENIIEFIFKDFLSLKNDKEGFIEAAVKTAVKLSDEEKKLFKSKIDEFTNLKSIPNFSEDKSLIGGFTFQVKDTILDASIKRQLELLKSTFRKTNIS